MDNGREGHVVLDVSLFKQVNWSDQSVSSRSLLPSLIARLSHGHSQPIYILRVTVTFRQSSCNCFVVHVKKVTLNLLKLANLNTVTFVKSNVIY